MKIIMKYILTNVKERRTRTAVMLLSVILSSALLFVSCSISASYESAQRKMARGISGSAAAVVRPAGENGSIDGALIPDLPSVGAKAGILKGSSVYYEGGYYETVDLIAAELRQLENINKPRLTDGGELSELSPGQIVLPDRFTSKFGIQRGDTVTLRVNGNPESFTVAEIAAYDTLFLRQTRGATALLSLPDLAGILGKTTGYSEILVKPAEGVSREALIADLKEALPGDICEVSEAADESLIEAGARQKSMPFFLISFFSLTMSVFIIYSSYKVITLERLPIIGTFRSIGAPRKTVTGILLLESLLYGSIGGLLGIPAGILVLKLILRGMGSSLSGGIEIPAVCPPLGIILSLSAAVTVSLLSAWIPASRAGRLPVKEVVLGKTEEKTRPVRLTMGIGATLFLASAALPRLVSGTMRYAAGVFSLLGLIAAAILVIPLFADLCSMGLERLYGLLFGNEGRLAARNLKGNKSIVQNITLLFISISAVIAIQVVGDFVTAYITDVFRDAELEGFADGPMDREFVQKVEHMEGIHRVVPVYVYNNEIAADQTPLPRAEATEDLEAYSSMFGLTYTEEGMETQAAAAFRDKRAVLLSEECLKQRDLSLGDTLTLSDGDVSYPYTVTGSFKSRATDVEAIIPASMAVSDFGKERYGLLAYTARDPDGIMVQIRDLFGETSNWSRTTEEFNQDALSTVEAFLQPMHSMTYFILLLAAAGVINNLLIQYIQNRRTAAMYKSVGQSRRQYVRMTLLEGFSAGLMGAAAAVAVSYVEIQTIFLVAGPKIAMQPRLHGSVFLAAGAMGIAVNMAGCLVPLIKNRKMKIVEEIKYE